jgi:hypothetical protein
LKKIELKKTEIENQNAALAQEETVQQEQPPVEEAQA